VSHLSGALPCKSGLRAGISRESTAFAFRFALTPRVAGGLGSAAATAAQVRSARFFAGPSALAPAVSAGPT
jgi:hypothetical protein